MPVQIALDTLYSTGSAGHAAQRCIPPLSALGYIAVRLAETCAPSRSCQRHFRVKRTIPRSRLRHHRGRRRRWLERARESDLLEVDSRLPGPPREAIEPRGFPAMEPLEPLPAEIEPRDANEARAPPLAWLMDCREPPTSDCRWPACPLPPARNDPRFASDKRWPCEPPAGEAFACIEGLRLHTNQYEMVQVQA